MIKSAKNKQILSGKFFVLLLLFCSLFLCTICSSDADKQDYVITEKTYNVLGTVINLKISTTKNKDEINKAEKALAEAYDAIKNLENYASVYNKDSDISKINANAGIEPVKVCKDLINIITAANKISELTEGSFDISFEAFLKIWKTDTKEGRVPSDKEIEEMIKKVNYKNIEINEENSTVFLKEKGMAIGVGGIAKGTASELASTILKKHGFRNFIVAIAGDIYVSGFKDVPEKQKWRIGIQHPRKKDELIDKVDLSDKSISTSGDYERFQVINGKTYHHIFDPRTGKPAGKSISVTIITDNAQYADALATGIFVLGPEKGIKLAESLKNFEVYIIDPNLKVYKSSGFDKYLVK